MPLNKVKQTILKPVTEGFREDRDLPVIPVKVEAEDALSAKPHSHPRGQLIYASRGVVRVITPDGNWLVPPTQTIWIPPHVEHDVFFPGKVTLYSLFVSEAECCLLPGTCTVFKVSPLLREMILRAFDWGDSYLPHSAGYRFMYVLIDEIARSELTKIDLPSAKSTRLVKITKILAAKPHATPSVMKLADIACVSSRTLARLFISEMGMTLGEWNRRLLVQYAIDQLSKGKTVTHVALGLGYGNPSSFIQMFKKSTGVAPAKYTASR
jgi:AraC-like DNA-binding protein